MKKFKPNDKVEFVGFAPGGILSGCILLPATPYTVKEYAKQKKDGHYFLMIEEEPDWWLDENVFKHYEPTSA